MAQSDVDHQRRLQRELAQSKGAPAVPELDLEVDEDVPALMPQHLLDEQEPVVGIPMERARYITLTDPSSVRLSHLRGVDKIVYQLSKLMMCTANFTTGKNAYSAESPFERPFVEMTVGVFDDGTMSETDRGKYLKLSDKEKKERRGGEEEVKRHTGLRRGRYFIGLSLVELQRLQLRGKKILDSAFPLLEAAKAQRKRDGPLDTGVYEDVRYPLGKLTKPTASYD